MHPNAQRAAVMFFQPESQVAPQRSVTRDSTPTTSRTPFPNIPPFTFNRDSLHVDRNGNILENGQMLYADATLSVPGHQFTRAGALPMPAAQSGANLGMMANPYPDNAMNIHAGNAMNIYPGNAMNMDPGNAMNIYPGNAMNMNPSRAGHAAGRNTVPHYPPPNSTCPNSTCSATKHSGQQSSVSQIARGFGSDPPMPGNRVTQTQCHRKSSYERNRAHGRRIPRQNKGNSRSSISTASRPEPVSPSAASPTSAPWQSAALFSPAIYSAVPAATPSLVAAVTASQAPTPSATAIGPKRVDCSRPCIVCNEIHDRANLWACFPRV